MDRERLLKNLEVPTGCVDVVLDTDAFNELDDQFAIALLLSHPERLHPVGFCAAPFLNELSTSPEDGMEKSYNEILKLLSLMGREDLKSAVYRGSRRYCPDEQTPVESEAARFLVETAKRYSPEKPLYIVAIGAITNVASAILMEPRAMTENTVIVWLGGHALHWKDTKEFNLWQDVAGARVLFGCGVPLVQLPCIGVVDTFRLTKSELEAWLRSTTPIGDYLAENTISACEQYASGKAWSRVIWDVTAVGWLLNDGGRFMTSRIIPSPIPQYDGTYAFDDVRHPICYVDQIHRDSLMTDLLQRIATYSPAPSVSEQ